MNCTESCCCKDVIQMLTTLKEKKLGQYEESLQILG